MASSGTKERCIDHAAFSALKGSGVGFFWGGVNVLMDPAMSKTRMLTKAKFALRSATVSMVGFAALLGLYTSLSCQLSVMRKKEDPFNYLVAGATVGALAVLPSRNPRAIAQTAFFTGTVAVVLHHFVPSPFTSKT